MRHAQSAEHSAFTVLDGVGLLIEIGLLLVEEPVHSIGHGRSHVDILEQGEIRKTDLEIVRHTVVELFGKAWLTQF